MLADGRGRFGRGGLSSESGQLTLRVQARDLQDSTHYRARVADDGPTAVREQLPGTDDEAQCGTVGEGDLGHVDDEAPRLLLHGFGEIPRQPGPAHDVEVAA